MRHNLHELRACIDAESSASEIWAVLKADGYGHGARNIAVALQQAGVDGVCVALLEEGLELRAAGVTCPVLVMGGYYGRYRDGVEALVEQHLTPVVYDAGHLEAISAAMRYMGGAASLGGKLRVHLKIDTGMGRLGVRAAELGGMLATLRNYPELDLVGLMTHLACAEDAESADGQLDEFEQATELVRRAGLAPPVRHVANSAAMLRTARTHYQLVRPGIALFGVHPTPGAATEVARVPNFKPVMRVVSEVVALRQIPTGAALGYGHTWRAARPSTIATIPMGYGDGLSRAMSNRGCLLICGKRAPIVGNVSMDLTTVDVTDIPDVCVRDEVVILGEQRGRLGSDAITVHELAEHAGTISWECLTSISRRVPRYYRQP